MLRRGARVLVVALVVLLGGSGVTACRLSAKDAATVCDFTAPLIKLIVLALKATPETALGSISLDTGTITITAACKRWLASNTEPTTAEKFLSVTTQVPAIFRIPADAGVCGAGPTEFASVAAVVATTSCPFSLNVQGAFLASNRVTPLTVNAWSPVTGRWYAMACRGDYPVVCSGGNAAVVYIY